MTIYQLCNTHPEKLEDLLLNYLCPEVENVSELPKMLIGINYLDDKENLIQKTTECEVIDADNYKINQYCVDESGMKIDFQFSFIMQTFIDDAYIWRVQGFAHAEIVIKNDVSINVQDFDPDDYQKYADFIKIKDLHYTEVECDTLYVI